MKRKVYITGLGAISALGVGMGETGQALRSSPQRAPVPHPATQFATSLQLPLFEVARSNEELKELLGLPKEEVFSRTTLLGMVAAKEALGDFDGAGVGLISGSSVGGMDLTEQLYGVEGIDPASADFSWLSHHDVGDHTLEIARYLSLSGFYTSISTACSSAANAILLGSRLIEQGQLDAVLVGGSDALCQFTLNGFNSLQILSHEPCRPFDRDRQGLNLGEGAAYLLLQSEESLQPGQMVYGLVAGGANRNDAHHQTASSPDGRGAYEAMSAAVARAGIAPKEVGYIQAHGTATENNDLTEAIAIERLFGATGVPPFSSTKPFTGHLLGASGAIEAVISLLSLQTGDLFPNLHFAYPIPEVGLSPITGRTTMPEGKGYILSNSFGFGGNCTSLIFQKYETAISS